MANEKKVETSKPDKSDIDKQVANMGYTIRKIKNWLEVKLGADIDGDGRVGRGPTKMALMLLLAAGAASSLLAAPYNTNITVWYPARGAPQTYIDQSGGIHAPLVVTEDLTINTNLNVAGDAAVDGTLGVAGKTTLAGELEVNGSDVDINMTLSGNEIDIAQTNAVGTEGVALIEITDARAGATASDTNEATLVINSAGAYALAVNSGLIYSLIGFEGVGSLLTALDAANLTAGTTASAINGPSITNLTAGNIAAGGTFLQQNGAALTSLDAANISAGTTASAINGTAITNIDAANLTAGTTASAVDLASCTNLPKVGLVQAVQDSLDLADSSLQTAGALTATNLMGPFVFTWGETAKVVSCTAQISDINGDPLARLGFADVWMCNGSAASIASTNNVASIAIRAASGQLIYTNMVNGYYKAAIPSDGTLEFDVTYEVARTSDFINVAIGGDLKSTTVLELTD